MKTGGRRAGPITAALVFGSVLLIGGCTTDQQASGPGSSVAQQNLPAPVSARTLDPAAPTTLDMAGASAPIDAVSTDTSGALLPPQDVHRLGWWVDSALPGSGNGTVVITGHVDEVTQGTGFASAFRNLHPGDQVTLDTASGKHMSYRVDHLQNADKRSEFPAADLNRLDGPETVALVTCGGTFVGPPLGYADNVIAWAVPS